MCSRKGVSGKRQSEDKRLKCPMSKTKSPINRGRELRPHSRWEVLHTKVAKGRHLRIHKSQRSRPSLLDCQSALSDFLE